MFSQKDCIDHQLHSYFVIFKKAGHNVKCKVIVLKGVVCQEAHIVSGIMGGLLKELFKIIFNA